MAWLQLIRWKNLLIIFFTQLLAWYCVILPARPIILDIGNFLLLSVSTLLIAAAGYIINDYFDIKIDTINRPNKMVLGKFIPRKQAIIAHICLNAVAVILAALLAAKAHHLHWLGLQLTCILLLWFYSTHFKRQFMSGNIVIALLTAFTILTLVVYEPIVSFHPNAIVGSLPFLVLCLYAYFSFMLTWMREIVKDMEDYKGDAMEGCTTMPIKWGLQASVIFTFVLGALSLLPLLFAIPALYQAHFEILSLYILVGIALPLAGWCLYLGRKATSAHYAMASRILKLIMISGVFSLLIYYFQIYINHGI